MGCSSNRGRTTNPNCLDLFSTPLSIHYKGTSRYTSTRSCLFTFLLFAWIVILTVFFWLGELNQNRTYSLSQILSNASTFPVPTNEQSQSETNPLTQSEFIIAIGIENQANSTQNFNDSSYYSLEGNTAIEVNLDLSLQEQRTVSQTLPLVSCNLLAGELDDNSEYSQTSMYSILMNLSSGFLCANLTGVIESLPSDTRVLNFELSFSTCDPSQVTCQPSDQMNSFLANGRLTLYFPRFAPPLKGEILQSMLSKASYPIGKLRRIGYTIHQNALFNANSDVLINWLTMSETTNIEFLELTSPPSDPFEFISVSLTVDSSIINAYTPETPVPFIRYFEIVITSSITLYAILSFLHSTTPDSTAALIDDMKLELAVKRPYESHLLLNLLQKAKPKIAQATLKDNPQQHQQQGGNIGFAGSDGAAAAAIGTVPVSPPVMNTDNFFESCFQSPFSQQNMSNVSNNVNFTPHYQYFELNSVVHSRNPAKLTQTPSQSDVESRLSPTRQHASAAAHVLSDSRLNLQPHILRFNSKHEIIHQLRNRSSSQKAHNIISSTSLRKKSASIKQIANQIPSLSCTPSMQSISFISPLIQRPHETNLMRTNSHQNHHKNNNNNNNNNNSNNNNNLINNSNCQNIQSNSTLHDKNNIISATNFNNTNNNNNNNNNIYEEEDTLGLGSPLSSPINENQLIFPNSGARSHSEEVLSDRKIKIAQLVQQPVYSGGRRDNYDNNNNNNNQNAQFMQLIRQKRPSTFAPSDRRKQDHIFFSTPVLVDNLNLPHLSATLPNLNQGLHEPASKIWNELPTPSATAAALTATPANANATAKLEKVAEDAAEKDHEQSSKRHMSLSQLDLSYFSGLEKSSTTIATSALVMSTGGGKQSPDSNPQQRNPLIAKALGILSSNCAESNKLFDELSIEKIRLVMIEVDRIKKILFNPDQLALFEYIIHSPINNLHKKGLHSSSTSNNQRQQHQTMASTHQNSSIDIHNTVIQGWKAIQAIDRQSIKSEVDIRLFDCVNTNITCLINSSNLDEINDPPIQLNQLEHKQEKPVEDSPFEKQSDHELTQSLALASRMRRRVVIQPSSLSESSSMKIIGDENLP